MKYKHLRTKILLLLFIVSTLLIVVTESYNYTIRKEVLYNISIEKLLILTKTMRNIEKSQLQLYKTRFKQLSNNISLLKSLEHDSTSKHAVIQTLMSYFKESTPKLVHLHIYNNKGVFLYSSDKTGIEDDHKDVPSSVLLQSMHEDSLAIGYVLNHHEGYYRSIIAPIKEHGTTLFYVEFGIEADELFKLASKSGRYKYALYLRNMQQKKENSIGTPISSNSNIFKELNITQEFIYKHANKNSIIEHNNKYYLFHQYDIESPFQKNFAQVVMASDVTSYVDDNTNKTLIMIAISWSTLFILTIFLYFVLTKLIRTLEKEENELQTKQTEMQIIMNNSESLIALINEGALTVINTPFLHYSHYKTTDMFIDHYQDLSKLFVETKDTFSSKGVSDNSIWIDEISQVEERNRIVALQHNIFGLNYFNVTITQVPEHDNSKVVIFSNITSIFQKSKKDEYSAHHDPLTNIYNRQYFNEIVAQNIFTTKYKFETPTLLMLDLDYFKNVNDTYGHQTGDDVLVHFTKIISQNIRESDVFARWGGEEFLVLLSTSNTIQAKKVAELLRGKIEEADFKEAGKITCSIGMSQYVEGDTLESWLSRVDKALYEAKDKGRNRVETIACNQQP